METIGVRPVVVDAYDRDTLIAAVGEAKPDVIVHQLTDLSTADFAATTRLRIEGTRNLVDAAMAVGVRRMIAQSSPSCTRQERVPRSRRIRSPMISRRSAIR